jgi:hypothetical protein
MLHLDPQGSLALSTVYLALALVFWIALAASIHAWYAAYRKMQACSERDLQANVPGHAPLLAM